MKYDYAFIDLDDTLYDTRRFKEDIFSVFRPFGISHKNFLIAYQQAAELGEFGYYDYTFEKQIQTVRSFGADVPDSSVSDLNVLLDHNYIIEGAENFLIELKKCCRHLILMTAGNIDFQAKKISAIGVAPRFDEIIQIPGGKDAVVKKYSEKTDHILFVNDNLEENRIIKGDFPAVDVLTVLNLSYWTAEECENSGITWFRNLDEITKFISNI
jgi:FMN phosphatase YigB (HAD superfamily)